MYTAAALVCWAVLPALAAASSALGDGVLVLTVDPDESKTITTTAALGGGLRFSSVHTARDELRARIAAGSLPAGGARVTLQPGVHSLATPLHLDSRDSGRPGAPIVWQAAAGGPGGGALLSGGVRIPVTAWGPCASAQATASAVCADLGKLGLSELGELGKFTKGVGLKECETSRSELFYNGAPMQLARWPNIGADGSWLWAHVDNATTSGFKYNSSEACPAAQHKWSQEADPWLHSYFHSDWSDRYLQMTGIDADTSTIMLNTTQAGPIKHGGRWYAVNLLAEMDAPSECVQAYAVPYNILESTGLIDWIIAGTSLTASRVPSISSRQPGSRTFRLESTAHSFRRART